MRSLDDYVEQIHQGEAFTDNMGYAIPILPSGRESFSPDASYYAGAFPKIAMRFINGPPKFAAEVRSETDYLPGAVDEMADKRADYFQAGTQVVWDVDTLAECIHAYRAADPEHPTTIRRGDTTDAEPGWRVAVDWVFG